MNSHSDFLSRHLGSVGETQKALLADLGYQSLDELTRDIVPADILLKSPLTLSPALSEQAALKELQTVMSKNKLLKSYIGQGITALSCRA